MQTESVYFCRHGSFMRTIRCLLAVYMILGSITLGSARSATDSSESLLQDAQRLAIAVKKSDLTFLRRSANQPGPLRDLYALHAAQLLLAREKDLSEAHSLLSSIPSGPTRSRAEDLEIAIMLQLGEDDKAAELTARSGRSLVKTVSQEEQDLLKVRTLRRAGKHTQADTLLLRLSEGKLRDAVSRTAVQELYRRYRAGRFVPIPSKPSLLLRFAQILLSHRRLPHAIDLAKRVIAAPKISTKKEIGEAWFLLGKIYSKKKNRWYAAKCFGEASQHLPDTSSYRSEALYLYANTYQQLKRPQKARRGYQAALKAGGNFAPAALWQIGHLDLKAGKDLRGLNQLRKLARTFPRSYFAPKALWKVALTLLENKAKPQEVKDAFLTFLHHFPRHRLANAARYRAGLAANQGFAIRTAKKLWQDCIHLPTTPDLYSLFAAQRLAGIKQPSFAQRHGPGWEKILARFPADVRQSPLWPGLGPELPLVVRHRIQALKSVRLLSDLEADLAYWTQQKSGRNFLTKSCYAWVLHTNHLYRNAVGLFETRNASRKPIPPKERGIFLSGMYPQAFLDQLAPQAQRFGVALPLVLAISREESHFAPDLQSWANARGLMQVIPSTAKWIAEKLGRKTPGDLYDPGVSIELGSWYLAYLQKRFARTAEPELLAIAGYNGGPGNVRRWLKKKPVDDVVAFLDVLDREETFFYVYKVTRSMMAYEAIEARQVERASAASSPSPKG
jgi:soluble lytic murein transglycosylase